MVNSRLKFGTFHLLHWLILDVWQSLSGLIFFSGRWKWKSLSFRTEQSMQSGQRTTECFTFEKQKILPDSLGMDLPLKVIDLERQFVIEVGNYL